MDVNEIFRDLGTMIHEQGEMIGKSQLESKAMTILESTPVSILTLVLKGNQCLHSMALPESSQCVHQIQINVFTGVTSMPSL